MALIVEDGTGKADADSYISTEDADAYHRARFNEAWALLSGVEKEAALRKATDYMTAAYGPRWSGVRVSASQALDWPRSGVVSRGFTVDAATVPAEVSKACAELAVRAAAGQLLADVGRTVVREKVDVLEVQYSEYGPQSTRFAAVDAMLAQLFGGMSGVSRKVVRS